MTPELKLKLSNLNSLVGHAEGLVAEIMDNFDTELIELDLDLSAIQEYIESANGASPDLD